ncbi:hypothetical protein IJ843_00955 [bacterium]|nr:hypothetical protein [bacterium]
MTIIRKLRISDKDKVKNMISFLGNDEAEKFVKKLISTSCDIFHYWLPLKMKFLTESYVLVDEKDLHGMISVIPASGNPYKINITKLLFKKDYYDIGKHLVEFIISRFGAKGAQTFIAAVDESHDELLKLFIDGCGFRKCASEELWRINHVDFRTSDMNAFRKFRNSDAQAAAMLFNDSLITHFKPSLLKTKDEYSDIFFTGLSDGTEFKYVLEDVNLHTLAAFFSIKTYDNYNYVIDITVSNGFIPDYDTILGFARNEIQKRQKEFSMFIKSKKYVQNSENFEEYLKEKDFKCVQNQMILVKDFYKLIKQDVPTHEVILFAETTGRPVFKL